MKQINKFLLTLLLTGAGTSVAFADPYVCGFDMAVDTSNPNFKAASNWKHLADSWMADDNGELKYMSYTWKDGVLSASRQYACSSSYSSNGRVVFDCLITPVVSGRITLDIQTSILASSAYPSYVEVYAYDEVNNKRGEQLKRIDTSSNPELNYSDFTTGIEIADLETPQRLALRLQYVSIDNFIADNAELVVEKSLKIDSYTPHVMDPTSGTWYWRQAADLSVPVTFTVVVTNNGDGTSYTRGR